MPFDAFLKVDGIPGESSDSKHKDQIEVLSFSWGASQAGGAQTSRTGGHTGARADVHDFQIVKVLDKSSPNLFLYCVGGKHIPSVVLELCSAAGDKHNYMKYTLTDALITSVRPGGAESGEGERPLEEISFRFSKIELEYTPFDNKGKAQAALKSGWSLETNKAV
jgi:type VI secretion system secreted protein Hcp